MLIFSFFLSTLSLTVRGAVCNVSLITSRGEYLLVFSSLAVYVGKDGRKSREREILFPAVPVAVGTYPWTDIYSEADGTPEMILSEAYHLSDIRCHGLDRVYDMTVHCL